MGFLEKAKKSQWYGVGLLLVITVLCWAVFKVLCPDTFGAPDQLLTYLQTGIIYAVGGCGLYFIVVMGLWDFSIGSVLVLACLLSIGFAQMFASSSRRSSRAPSWASPTAPPTSSCASRR